VSQAKRSQVTQRLKHIHRVADFIEQDVIEFFARLEKLAELVFVWEGDCEFKGRIAFLCDFHDLGTDVDAFALARSNSGQVVAGAAAN
jgi:hypothetical protein